MGSPDKSIIGSLRFLQSNLHHSIEASRVFNETHKSENIHIGLITEPYLYNESVKIIQEGDLIYSTTTNMNHKPRACIFIKHNIPYFVLSQFISRDVVAVKLRVSSNNIQRNIVVCSVYMDGNEDIPLKLNEVLNYCNDQDLEIIIGTDSNAHHTIWGDKKIDVRGEMVMDFLVNQDLEIMNRGNTPTFIRGNSETVIDLTLAKGTIMEQISNWRVSNYQITDI